MYLFVNVKLKELISKLKMNQRDYRRELEEYKSDLKVAKLQLESK
jgi:hypothetical protein